MRWESDTIMAKAHEDIYAAVALNVPLPGPFHYSVPSPLRDSIKIGARVRVPFGRREMTGFCVGFSDTPEIEAARIKPILRLVDKELLLDERMLELTRWMAWYYCCSWGEALDAVLPSGVKKQTTTKTVLFVSAARSRDEMRDRAMAVEKRAPRQARLLRALALAEGEITARDLAADYGVIHALHRNGDVTLRRKKIAAGRDLESRVEHTEPPVLTAEQAAVLDRVAGALRAGKFHVALLHGVTGSGKTEVYLQALRHVVDSGKQGIVLVPEIALTPQTIARFRARFDRVSVLHSEMTERSRREHWRAIRAGNADVVVGTRSAVFAPVPKLGLLVVDEEFESSFKQQNVPRYHARDVGIWRARQEGALVLLGSATPSLETFQNARSGKYELLELKRRVRNRPMPPVRVENMALSADKRGAPPMLSRSLSMAMATTLARGEQISLLLNRRGFNTYMACRRCGFALKCKHCDVSMIYHQRQRIARCHYCHYEQVPPRQCPGCGADGIKYRGTGTERVEEVISKLFGPEIVARMDSDTMRGTGRYEKTLGDFRDGRIRILLGTQMVAKGLDFPNVTLVGVVNADVILNLPDFRASERTFQLLAQVAGRAGRGNLGGYVIVQTFAPDHPCIRQAARHDYHAFAKRELESRRRLNYPPFARLARILVEGDYAKSVENRCSEIVASVRATAAGRKIQILGPTEAPIARIKNRARWHALLKAPDAGDLHEALAAVERRKVRGIQVSIDVDPVSLL